MIEEAKQYLIDQGVIMYDGKSNNNYIDYLEINVPERLIELLVNFSRIQLQKQHEKTLKLIRGKDAILGIHRELRND